MTTQPLTRDEAIARRALLDVASYDIDLDLTTEGDSYESVTTVRFSSGSGTSFIEVRAVSVRSIRLDGSPVDVSIIANGRLPLRLGAGEHELVVDALMPYRNDGEGLHRSIDPADGAVYLYATCFLDAAPTMFACFDQPDLKATYRFHVRTPPGWIVRGNSIADEVSPGVWELGETPPLSTYFVTLVAGPYHLISDEHDGIPLGLSARASLAKHLDADADELFTMTKQCFDEFHRLFGIRYPFAAYHQAFVPDFNAGAMENAGCVTLRDPLVFQSRVTRGMRIQRARTVAHEMAHMWFGDLVTPVWWDDLWLNESFAEYLGTRVTADVTEYDDARIQNAYVRRQWGLEADQGASTHPVAGTGATDTSTALLDFDGISYAKGAAILKQLNARVGDEVFFGGVISHFNEHRFGNATMHDLIGAWERAGAGDLTHFTASWLQTSGPDALTYDRANSRVLLANPPGHPADRTHTFRVARGDTAGWTTESITVGAGGSAFDAGPDQAVVLDPYEDTWAVAEPDPTSVALLKELVPHASDAHLRAGVWNNALSSFRRAHLSPDDFLDLIDVGLPVETVDDCPRVILAKAIRHVAPLSADPAAAFARIHAASVAKTHSSLVGSTLQLAAMQGAIDSALDPAVLRGWLDGQAPDGIDIDLDLRWKILVALAVLGATDRAELEQALDAEPTAVSKVEHTRAVASLPDAAAKSWAWDRFTGVVDATNYEIEAAALGLWHPAQTALGHQRALTAPYIERFFTDVPETLKVRSGYLVSEAALAFAPTLHPSRHAVSLARTLIDRDGLDTALRRTLIDINDDLEHRLRIVETFGRC